MDATMTSLAQRDQVFGRVISQGAPAGDVVDFKFLHRSALLTAPSIALKNFLAKFSIGVPIESQARPPLPDRAHDASLSCRANSIFCGWGSKA
jgi:hypothetical protein